MKVEFHNLIIPRQEAWKAADTAAEWKAASSSLHARSESSSFNASPLFFTAVYVGNTGSGWTLKDLFGAAGAFYSSFNAIIGQIIHLLCA